MLIPIGLDDTRLNRVPIVTFALIVGCFLVYLVGIFFQKNDRMEAIRDFLNYYSYHPYLEIPEELIDNPESTGLNIEVFQRMRDELMNHPQYGPAIEKIRPTETGAEQARLNDLASRIIEVSAHDPDMKWGFINAKADFLTLFSHLFLHAGFWHLLGNMIFLYLMGPFVEDKWGRPFFLGFYLIGGAAAAIMFMFHYPSSNLPLVGASGAVSAVLGAFLVKFWNRKIKLFYWFFIIIRGTFFAVAWIVLPLWFLLELLNAGLNDALNPDKGGGGVAHWAHVWGFVFGFGVAVVLRKTRWEQKINPLGLDLDDPANNPIKAAELLEKKGKDRAALDLLAKAAVENPNFLDIWQAYWQRALKLGDLPAIVKSGQKLLRASVEDKAFDDAYYFFHLMIEKGVRLNLPHSLLMALAKGLVEEEKPEEAEQILLFTYQQLRKPSPLVLASMAECAAKVNHGLALDWVRQALSGEELDAGLRRRLRALESGLSKDPRKKMMTARLGGQIPLSINTGPEQAPFNREPTQQLALSEPISTPGISNAPSASDDSLPEADWDDWHTPSESPLKRIKAFPAVPEKWTPDGIQVVVQGKFTKVVKFAQIKGIALGALREPQAKPVLVLDLLFDSLSESRAEHRVFRIRSDHFQPQKLVPKAPSPFQALLRMVRYMLAKSGAEPLPTNAVVEGKDIGSYPSLEAYEAQIYFSR